LIKIFTVLIVFCNLLFAKEISSLRVGAGMSFVSLPEYIGSAEQKNYIFPYPYVYYNSENFTLEENTLFRHLYHSENFVVDLSFSGTLPVESDKDSLRYGMKKLDPTLEIGPNFIYKLVYFNETSYLSLELPIRTVFSIDFPKMKSQGYLTNPNLYIKYFIQQNLKIELSTGPTFANKKYYNYFYEVKQNDVTVKRKKYQSKSGYGGWKSTIGISQENDKIWYGGFMRYYDLTNAKYIDSSLVNDSKALFFGVAISYIF